MKNQIEIFIKGCELCKEVLSMVELGKCLGCELVVRDVREKREEDLEKVKEYDVKVFPTIIINNRIKIEGKPKFPLICSPELYKFLERNYRFR
ncbi:MAG: thioredoxin family protein [Nitrososphaerales archaeon]